MVMTGDRILPYKIARMEESGFKVSSKLAEGFDFVYYFTIRFAKGITVIRHSYLYRGGASVEASHDFLYRLTTGATWAGGSIGDFELNINMGDDCYFAVPSAFGSTAAAWTLVGVGRIGAATVFNPYGDEEGGRTLRMVYLRKGKLQLRQLNFKPQKDLGLTVFQFHNEVNLWTDKKTPHVFENSMDLLMGDSTDVLLRRMTDLELRLYRNLHFARMGYDFKDEALKKVFMQFTWYIPDPAIKAENAPDYYLSKELLKLITEEESRRKAGRNAPAEKVISHSACRHGRQHTRQECKSSKKYEVRSTALRMKRRYWHLAPPFEVRCSSRNVSADISHPTTHNSYLTSHNSQLISHIPQLTTHISHPHFVPTWVTQQNVEKRTGSRYLVNSSHPPRTPETGEV